MVLERIAPTRLAEDWDNVGLLVDPRAGGEEARAITKMFLTIDLTEPVLAEAREVGAELIVAYHPPIFRGLKRLSARRPLERVVATAIRQDMAIYCPHTALDVARDGVNDWLANGLGEGPSTPLKPSPVDHDLGFGRRKHLHEPVALDELTERVKKHLGLKHVRVAATQAHRDGQKISDVAVCAGAGGEVFEGVRMVDVYLTGEMRHHDVLERVATGSSVILTDHTNTERGYLPWLAERLKAELEVEIHISEIDADPLQVQ